MFSLTSEESLKKFNHELAIYTNTEYNITGETPYSLRSRKTEDFVPFIKERDSIGRLINLSNSPKKVRSAYGNFNWLDNELKKFVHTRPQPIINTKSLTKLLTLDSPRNITSTNTIRMPKTSEDDKINNNNVYGFWNDKQNSQDQSQPPSIALNTGTSTAGGVGVGIGEIDGEEAQAYHYQHHHTSHSSYSQPKSHQSSQKNLMLKNSSSFMSPNRENHARRAMKRLEKMPSIGYYDIVDIRSTKPKNTVKMMKKPSRNDFSQGNVIKTDTEVSPSKLNIKLQLYDTITCDTNRTEKSLKAPDFSKQLSRHDIMKRSLSTKKDNKIQLHYTENDTKGHDKLKHLMEIASTNNLNGNRQTRITSHKTFHNLMNQRYMPLGLQEINEMRRTIMRKNNILRKNPSNVFT